MLPYKHYSAYEIEEVLRQEENLTTSPHECGAEESTLRRWKQEFPDKLSEIAALLESLANMSNTLLLSSLRRIYKALEYMILSPPTHGRLAWAFFLSKSHLVHI